MIKFKNYLSSETKLTVLFFSFVVFLFYFISLGVPSTEHIDKNKEKYYDPDYDIDATTQDKQNNEPRPWDNEWKSSIIPDTKSKK